MTEALFQGAFDDPDAVQFIAQIVRVHRFRFDQLAVLQRGIIDPEIGIRDVDFPLADQRSEEHTSELQSLMRISYAVFCLKKQINKIKLYKNKTTHQR